ncbi:MAG: helix-turn-helix domain-containing protein [Bacteroidales bacterium]|nr:helix-turn-helix domain-containing protein [Bacteroidales bacterium]
MIKRIQKILDHNQLSSSGFAEKIGLQRSNVSHVLSGRNKPSLDFILKILNAFPEINPGWLLTGNGTMKRDTPETNDGIERNIPYPETMNPSVRDQKIDDKKIERILIFYTDKTFDQYRPIS